MANQGQKDVFRRLLLLVAFQKARINKTSIPTTKNKMCDQIENYLGSFSGSVWSWLIDNGKGTTSVPTTNLSSVLDAVSKNLSGIQGSVASLDITLDSLPIWQEYRAEIEQYLTSLSRRNPKIENVLLAPDYDEIDPAAIDAQVKTAGENTNNVLKAHLLYHSPVAASQWQKIKSAGRYKPLYDLCEKGLEEIFASDEWKKCQRDLRLVFNLGAGSSRKDEMILEALSSGVAEERAYIWIDASYPMLHQTIKDVDRANTGISLFAIVADFETPKKVEDIYRNSFSQLLPEFKHTSKAFFVLGYTLSNLDEENFFSAYANVCREGDLFVFPMHFIPAACKDDKNNLDKFEHGLLRFYNFPEGQKFSEAGLNMLQLYKPTGAHKEPDFDPIFFNGHTHSRCLKFTVELRNIKAIDVTKSVVTAQSVRHYKDDYIEFLKKYGFIKIHESTGRVIDSKHPEWGVVQTLVVKYIGKQDTEIGKAESD